MGVVDVGFVLPGTPPRGLRFVALPADPVICVCADRDDPTIIALHKTARRLTSPRRP
jgi:hypothetical protein